MELFYKVDEWKVNEMSPEELLVAHDNISQQIDRLQEHWRHLNQHQTKIMTRFHEINIEEGSEDTTS